jgi:hypothetical protein
MPFSSLRTGVNPTPVRRRTAKTAHHLMAEYPHLKDTVLGTASVGTRIFLLRFGNVADEAIARYIAEQNVD